MFINSLIVIGCIFALYWFFIRKPKNNVTLDMANAAPYKVEAPVSVSAPDSIDLSPEQLTEASLNNGDSDAPEWLIERAAADDVAPPVAPKATRARKPRVPKATTTPAKPRAKRVPKVT